MNYFHQPASIYMETKEHFWERCVHTLWKGRDLTEPAAPLQTRPGRMLQNTRLFSFCTNIDLRRQCEPKHRPMKERFYSTALCQVPPLYLHCLLRKASRLHVWVHTINRDLKPLLPTAISQHIAGCSCTEGLRNSMLLISRFSPGLEINASAARLAC